MAVSAEERGIREAVQHYVEGMRTHKADGLKEGFHQQAILCGYLGDEMIAAPIEALYDWVSANPAPAETGEVFDCSILAIEVTGQGRDGDGPGNEPRRQRDRLLPSPEGQRSLVDCEQAVGRRARSITDGGGEFDHQKSSDPCAARTPGSDD